MNKKALILLVCGFEYSFLAVLLCLNFGVLTGGLIALACFAIHTIASGQTRLDGKRLKIIGWFIGAALVDFLLIMAGITCSFELIGGKVIENRDAMFELGEVSLQLVAGVTVIRLIITAALQLFRHLDFKKPAPTDDTANVREPE